MNDDVLSLLDSFNPSNQFNIGDELLYTEGVVRAKVKLLDIQCVGEHIEYKLELTEQIGRFPLPKVFEVSKRKGYEGWCGWSFRKTGGESIDSPP